MSLSINIWAWVAWIIVGLIAGLMAGRTLNGRRILLIDMIVGVIGSLAGGWGSVKALGDDTPQLFIISVLISLFVAGALLWFVDWMAMHLNRK